MDTNLLQFDIRIIADRIHRVTRIDGRADHTA